MSIWGRTVYVELNQNKEKVCVLMKKKHVTQYNIVTHWSSTLSPSFSAVILFIETVFSAVNTFLN